MIVIDIIVFSPKKGRISEYYIQNIWTFVVEHSIVNIWNFINDYFVMYASSESMSVHLTLQRSRKL